MKFTETRLAGAYVIDIERREDERGFFARVWEAEQLEALGLEAKFTQCSVSWNAKAGTLRGMHYQAPPHEEVKVVRCTMGAAFDVMVDLRAASPTFRQWVGVELNAENRRSVYIPRGFAHGFLSLANSTELVYFISTAQVSDSAQGIRWDDPLLGIVWPRDVVVCSDADRSRPLLEK